VSALPLSRRPLDAVLILFFAVNLFFVTPMIDAEQIVVADPTHFTYPAWPPRFAIDMIQGWARARDPLVWARPPWYRATIWLDVLAFGPFYAAALYAFARGRDWIRTPALVWAGMMIAVVAIIGFEEVVGPYATPEPGAVLLANGVWFALPWVVIVRLRGHRPFERRF
jgi:hypothetical protein